VTASRTTDVLVVGAGVIGCAVARELAATGRSVVVADRGPVGGEASSAAAGALGVASGGDEGERLALRRASLAAFPALVATLADETGIDVGYEVPGVVELAFDDGELTGQHERAARRRAQGLRAEPLDVRALRALEPGASGAAIGAVRYPDDALVEADAFVRALAEAARRCGAIVMTGTPVHGVERAGDRVVRARVGDGWIAPETVVIAAGAWSATIAGITTGIAVTPVRGQMLALRPVARCCHAILTGRDGFLVPRRSGELWVGATFEDAGFARAVTGEGLERLLAHVARLAPAALAAPVVRAWSGLRPGLDGGPVIARAPDAANVVVATGHYRNGILLAPITATAVAAVLAGTPVPEAVRPFVRA
jgi:glycine oxidase